MIGEGMRIAVYLLLVLALSGCVAGDPRPTPPALPLAPTAAPFTPPEQLPTSGKVTTVGILLTQGGQIQLAQAASTTAAPLGRVIQLSANEKLPAAGTIVLVRGVLRGADSLQADLIEPVVPEETSVRMLLERSPEYAGRVVRVNGGIVLAGSEAVLVDQLGEGGIPAADARQVKLRLAAIDPALLDRLGGNPDGPRYGSVQVEGYWRQGVLVALLVTPIGSAS